MTPHNVPLYILCFSLITILQSTLAQSNNYIIHMDPLAMPKAFSDEHNWYLSILTTISNTATATKILSSSKIIYTYTHVMNGFSASLTPSELEALKGTPGYIYSFKDLIVYADSTHTSEFLGLNPKFGAWPASKYGQDVIVGIVDTGIWPESESYNDEGMSEVPVRWKGRCENDSNFNSSICNKKLIGARYFNRGLIAQLPKNATMVMNSMRDVVGHGTHTSSVAAGNYVKDASYFGYARGTATGVAPHAHVAMYKALWEDRDSFTSDVIAAIDQAISDGVDVLSLSFGKNMVLPLYLNPIAIATFAAIEKGVFVSTPAGNTGHYFQKLHNGIPWVLTVAAGTIDREFGAVLGLGNGVKVSGSALYIGDFNSTQYPLVFMDDCNNSVELKNIRGKIVVCEVKNWPLSYEMSDIIRANVTGGIFITDSTRFYIRDTFPAIIMKPKDGETIKDYIERNKEPKATLEFGITNLGTKPQPTVSKFSSRGPSQSCPFVLKPDIMAPGDMVLGAWPSNIPVDNSQLLFSHFHLLSGTSMACSHAAGVAALLKSVHPEWSPAAIRSAMMTSADVMDNTQSPIKHSGPNFETAFPTVMGAGHVDPNKALDPGLIYDVGVNDYVNLLCGLEFTANQIRAITRSSTNNCSAPSLDLNYPSFIAYFNVNDSKSDMATVQEFQRTVTNVGEGMSTYIAKVPTLDGLKVSVTPDKLVFKEKNEKQSYKLSIEGPQLMKQEQVFGFLIWEEVGGHHVVKSPIVATSINSDITG
ncbi:subtilisin-like protease SBT3 [Tripterygium wilfordii]|uniref:subtilisin-like protease SBT3 n=1 Tax=Tripterygium wilfordii TaxID=458696 RepID=UPI0018F85BE2|nr:subtilisin-like protease SBT3 [Tripterygium wilfordii]